MSPPAPRHPSGRRRDADAGGGAGEFRRPRALRGAGGLAVKVATLAVVAACAILLWCFAGPRVGEAIDALRPPADGVVQVDARVTSCPSADAAQPCLVAYSGPGGPGRAVLVRVGLFDVAEGDELPVRVSGDRAVVAGWRPVVDAALLLALAGAFTGYTVGRWRAVLDHDTDRGRTRRTLPGLLDDDGGFGDLDDDPREGGRGEHVDPPIPGGGRRGRGA